MLTENETASEQQPDELKPRRKRAPRRRRVEEPSAPSDRVKVKADFTVPVAQFARFAEEEIEYEEEAEEDEEADSRHSGHMLYGDGLAPMPFQSRVVVEDHSDSVREHLRQVNEAAAFKARIWSVPSAFAQRNPMIQRKPKVAPGWAMRGEIQYDPETLESDLLGLFADGYYFVEVRERGTFCSGQLVTVGDPSSAEPTLAAPQTIIHESQPPVDPVKEANAQAKILDTISNAFARMLEAQSAQQPAQQKPQSLKDRLEELQMLKQMFAPPTATANPQPQRDPLEKLAEALESEALRKILGAVKSENPVQPAEDQSGFWDFAMNAVEQLAPGLNPLLAGLGRMLMSSGEPTAPQPPAQHATRAVRPVSSQQLPVVAEKPTTITSDAEDEGVDIRFLIQDLANQADPAGTAQKIKALMASKPFARPFLKQYLSAKNKDIWEGLIGLAENETEAADLRKALDACDWREDWLNSLKQLLQS